MLPRMVMKSMHFNLSVNKACGTMQQYISVDFCLPINAEISRSNSSSLHLGAKVDPFDVFELFECHLKNIRSSLLFQIFY